MGPRTRNVAVAVLFCVLACAFAASASAADWPQYRYDARRSAASPQELPAKLHLQWVRRFPPPRPAYPLENRLAFDRSYEPVVMGELMFVPSMVTDSVTALDTATGEEKWRFHAGGPVRLAPVAGRGKVYFVCDDGCLYCVNASTGDLLWKVASLPAGAKGRTDRKVLGDGRLISLRPARGGPVLAEGKVYFAAGIWPSEGIHVCAVDAETGKVVWSNTDSGRIENANADHLQRHYAGLAPQGHLAVVGGKLVIPSGRQLPGFFDAKTGKRGTYTIGWGGRDGLAKGASFAAGIGKYLFAGGDLYDLDTPLIQGERIRLYAGCFDRIQRDPACGKFLGRFREPVLTDSAIYYTQFGSRVVDGKRRTAGRIMAFDLTKPTSKPMLNPRKKGGKPPRPHQLPDPRTVTFPQRWALDSALKVHIKAGPRLYAGGPGTVAAVDTPQPGGQPKISWQTKIDSAPVTMLAAAERLFVVTDQGSIFAFGAGAKGKAPAHTPPRAAAPKADKWTEAVKTILKETKLGLGYALVLGVGEGRLAEELARQSNLNVVAVDPDAKKVARLRDRLGAAGLYGTRIAVHVGDPLGYPLPPYFARLVVSEDAAVLGSSFDRGFVRRIFHPLRPYGGTACLPIPSARREAFVAAVSQAKLPQSAVRQVGDLMLLTRRGALPGAGDWSHVLADAGNSAASRDTVVKPPLSLLWFNGQHRWLRVGQTWALVAGGHVFINERDLRAVDAFTGQHLWRRPRAVHLIAAPDAVYTTDAATCVVLDPATGREIRKMNPPKGATRWTDIRVWADFLIGASARHVTAMDRHSGKVAWNFECRGQPRCLVAGGGKVFCVAQSQGLSPAEAKRRGQPAGRSGTRTLAIDIKTGKVLWEVPKSSKELRYGESGDVLLASHGVYNASTGERLRDRLKVEGVLAISGDKLVGEFGDTYYLLTGKQLTKAAPWRKRGCTRPRVSSNLITTRLGGHTAYFDLATRRLSDFHGIRPACINNLVPADGLLNAPGLTGGCTCNYAASSYALAPASAIAPGAKP